MRIRCFPLDRCGLAFVALAFASGLPGANAQGTAADNEDPYLTYTGVHDTVAGGASAAETYGLDELGCSTDGSCCGRGRRVYVEAEALILDRDNGSSRRPVVIDTSQTGATGELLSTRDTDFDVAGGARFLLGFQPPGCRWCSAWEIGYMGVYDWEGSSVVSGANNLGIPGDLGLASNDFFGADAVRVDYDSELHSAEFNCVRRVYCCCCCGKGTTVDVLGGFRYFSLDETFNINSTDFDEGTSDYRVETDNNLYGFQLGARVRRCHGCFAWLATVKAGIYGNDAEQSQSVTDFPPPFQLRTPRSSSGGDTAFVGEINLGLSYQVTKVWSVIGGYNVLWLDGLALAPDQLDFTFASDSGTALNHNGGAFFHGASVGVAARW